MLTYDGRHWHSRLPVDPGGRTPSVSCPTSSFCVVFTQEGAVSLYDGDSWSQPEYVDAYWGDVSCSSSHFCVAIDIGGDAVTYRDPG